MRADVLDVRSPIAMSMRRFALDSRAALAASSVTRFRPGGRRAQPAREGRPGDTVSLE